MQDDTKCHIVKLRVVQKKLAIYHYRFSLYLRLSFVHGFSLIAKLLLVENSPQAPKIEALQYIKSKSSIHDGTKCHLLKHSSRKLWV